jgi:hypothetical protein
MAFGHNPANVPKFTYTVIFFWRNLFEIGRISSIAQPKNLLNWGNFAQIERNSPEIFGAKLNSAGSPISGEKNNYCVNGMMVFCRSEI